MTHASVPKEMREVLGIGDNFVRMSIGLEDADDLIKDLEQALIKAVSVLFLAYCQAWKLMSSSTLLNF